MATDKKKERVLLGVTGGIAAFKAAELVSMLTQEGFKVRVIMTQAARRMIGELTFAALSNNPVATDLFDPQAEASISHIELARWAELLAVVPATANFMAKAAGGIADDLLTTVLLACDAPLLLAPAMNPQMWAHAATQSNAALLKERGARIVGPAQGSTACGEKGLGRLAESALILDRIRGLFSSKDLAGVNVLISAGPTREHMDPVRFISNPSTGRMGIEAARAAAMRGARVTLVLGPTLLEPPPGMKTIRVVSAEDMAVAVNQASEEASVVIMAAAVSDYRPLECAPGKVKKGQGLSQECKLEATDDILAGLGRNKGGRILVGFAAETQDLLGNAAAKIKAKNLDLVVANDVSASDAGFAAPDNRVVFISPDGEVEELPLMSKLEVGLRLMDRVARLLKGGRG